MVRKASLAPLVLALAAGLLPTGSRANVNVNNGNFYIAYTDFFLPTAGINIELTRTYNSRSNYVRGYFGVGWSSEIEGYLRFEKGTVAYHEGGGGNIVKFAPSKGKSGEWENGLYGLQTLRQAGDTYVLKTAQGKDLSFDNQGHLIRIADRNKNFIDVVYANGRPVMLKDGLNNQVKMEWKEFGGSPRIVLFQLDDKKARYDYSKSGDLVKASGIDGVSYEYAYDDEHNLTRIGYEDGGAKEMSYDKARDWITRFKDRDGVVTTYGYSSDKLDPENKFGTTVTRARPNAKEKEVSRFWYEFRKRADGSRYNYRALTSMFGQVTESIFTECCGTPLVVSRWTEPADGGGDKWMLANPNKSTTSFEYYPDGLLKKKTGSDGTVTALTYHPEHKKVASVTKGGRKLTYNYDKRGNLAWAFDSADNRRMDLSYDLKGRITVIKDASIQGPNKETRFVYFRYNADGKPVEIKEKSGAFEGAIRVGYGPNGEVTGIVDRTGRTIAAEKEVDSARRVARTFQNLLEIVQPAGVTLTPEG
jgi:YD repeat-containing protein